MMQLAEEYYNKNMKRMNIKTTLMAGLLGLGMCGLNTLLADDPTTTPPTQPPVVIPPGDRELVKDLKGAPADVKTLIMTFDATRDKYLAQQKALLAQLKGATPEERQALRQQLQENRDAFLAELKTFRTDLRKDLEGLKGKISHAEFQRILDAAKDAAGAKAHKGTEGKK